MNLEVQRFFKNNKKLFGILVILLTLATFVLFSNIYIDFNYILDSESSVVGYITIEDLVKDEYTVSDIYDDFYDNNIDNVVPKLDLHELHLYKSSFVMGELSENNKIHFTPTSESFKNIIILTKFNFYLLPDSEEYSMINNLKDNEYLVLDLENTEVVNDTINVRFSVKDVETIPNYNEYKKIKDIRKTLGIKSFLLSILLYILAFIYLRLVFYNKEEDDYNPIGKLFSYMILIFPILGVISYFLL